MPRQWLLWTFAAFVLCGIGSSNGCNDFSDIIFVVDANPAMEDPNFMRHWGNLTQMLAGVTRDIGRKSPRTRFAFIRYARIGSVAFNLKTYERYQDVANEITKLNPIYGFKENDNAVNLNDALTLVETVMSGGVTGYTRKTTAVIISDQRPNVNSESTRSQAMHLRNEVGVRIVAVALSENADEKVLNDVLDPNHKFSNFYRIADYNEMGKHKSRLVNIICPPVQQFAELTTCSRDADIVLVMDSSGSMTETNERGWTLMREFADSFARELSRSDRKYRFGLVKFSERAIIEAPLQEYSDMFSTRIMSSTFMRWTTNHVDALRKGEQVLKQDTIPGRGQYIIIITDGVSNVNVDGDGDEDMVKKTADDVLANDIGIIAVGVTERLNAASLSKISGSSRNNILAQDFNPNLVGDLIRLLTDLQDCRDEQAIETPQTSPACPGAPEIVFLLDASGSIDMDQIGGWDILKKYITQVAAVIDQQIPNTRFGVVKFGPTAVIDSNLNSNLQEVIRIIDNSQQLGGVTNQFDGLKSARQVLADARPGASKYIIMVTDGTVTARVGEEYNMAKIIRDEGTRIIVIGVTPYRSERNLREIAGTDGVVFQYDTYGALASSIPPVLSAAKACPPNAVPCNIEYIVFAIDQSESIERKGTGNFELLKTFVKDLARSLYQRYSAIQFALVSFSDQADILRYFSNFKGENRLEEFLNAVSAMSSHNEMTNLAAALNKSREAIVKEAKGRSEILLITDGEPNMDVGIELAEAKMTRDLGIRILTLGVTNEINERTLGLLTDNPEYVFLSPDFQSLTPNVEPLIVTSCNRAEGEPATDPPECQPSDIVFVLDGSGSVDNADWQDAKALLKDLMIQLNSTSRTSGPSIRFGAVVFSSMATLVSDLNADIQHVISRLTDVRRIGQETNIMEGLRLARSQVFSKSGSDRRKVTVLISDGNANQYPLKEIEEAQKLKDEMDSTVVVLGLTDQVDFNVLERVASKKELVIGAPNIQSVRKELEQIINAVCVPPGQGSSPSRDFPMCKVDLALIVDSSSSIESDTAGNRLFRQNWTLIKQTLITLLNTLGEIGPAGVQVALVTFSTEATPRARFSDSSNPEVIQRAILDLKNDGFFTNMAEAFKVTKMDIFGPGKGKRSDARKVGFLITDGKPTLNIDSTYSSAQSLKAELDTLIVAGLSESAAEETLRSIASKSSYFTLRNYYDLLRGDDMFFQRIC